MIHSCHTAVNSLQSELETEGEKKRKTANLNKDSNLSIKEGKQQGEERLEKRESNSLPVGETKKDVRAEKK